MVSMFKPVSPKVDFPTLEREILNYWSKKDILKKYLSKNAKAARRFSFLDGPITANNPMGVHHAWGRTYKDLWQRFYNMRGFKQRFQNGFDCQGLWVEVEVEKELGLKSKRDIENLVPGDKFSSIAKFVDLCKERVKKYSAVQTEQSKRLGYFMDWDHSYYTMSDENNYTIWYYLKTIHDKGWLYKGRDTVPWCPRCGTAISQHEILTEEYQEITHKSVYLKYPLKTQNSKLKSQKEYLLVWTTTPWTLLSNVAIAVNPDLEYQGLEVDGNLLWFAKDAWSRLKEVIGEKTSLKGKNLSLLGKEMVGWVYEGPYDDLPAVSSAKKEKPATFHKVIPSEDLVTAEEGTGLVHIAPGAGEEDFDLAGKENLAVIASIDEAANYIAGFGDFTGKNAKEDPDLVLNDLEKRGFVQKIERYTHRYPVCWRCKTELVWRVVDEWYIAMDKPPSSKVKGQKSKLVEKTYREQMKEVIEDINWIPKWGFERELDWLNNMSDWLISKKRYWGLALPIWECANCHQFEVIGSREELKEKAIEGWGEFEGCSPHRPWIDKVKIKCSKCGGKVERVSDVGNPWLDAGIVPFSTYIDPKTNKISYLTDKIYWQEWFPADFITESFPGQFKNWFYSMIAMSTVLAGASPFKTVLGFATLMGEDGKPMHKSLGNLIEFNEAAEKAGVDVMRWIFVTQNPQANLNFGYHLADEVKKRFFLIWWNAYNFFVTYANIDKWVPDKKSELAKLTNVLDRWIISRIQGLIKKVTSGLEKYDATVSREIERFVIDDFSTWYIRRIRERIGPSATGGKDKNDAYQTLYYCLTTLAKLTAPFLPFTSEEIYKNLTGEESVHLANFPTSDPGLVDKNLEVQMQQVRELVEIGHSMRKQKGVKVRQPLAAATYGRKFSQLPQELEDLVENELNIKKVEYNPKIDFSFDWELTPNLKKEGEARELIRKIQDKRKESGVAFDDQIIAFLPSWPREFADLIKKETLARQLVKASEIKIEKIK
jgi:isoleucyl-tRNA synthetase